MDYKDWKKCYIETEKQIVSSMTEWLQFLNTCSNTYRIPFEKQISVYFQKPAASSLDTYAGWQSKDCQIVKGAKSLLFFDYFTGRRQQLFDISDTINSKKAINYDWSLNDNDIDFVKYSLEPSMYHLNLSEIILINVNRELSVNRDTYKNLIIASAAYICNLRCGIDISTDTFNNLSLPDNAMTLQRVGTTINYVSNIILTKIEKSLAIPEKIRYDIIRDILTQNNIKEAENHGITEINIPLGGGHSSPELTFSGTTERRTTNKIWSSEVAVSSGGEQENAASVVQNGRIGEISERGTRQSKQNGEGISREVSSTMRSDRGIEAEGLVKVYSADEQLSSESGRNGNSRSNKQLNKSINEKAEFNNSAFSNEYNKHNNSHNYVRYTEEEIKQAKRTNLVDFLQRNGESIKRVGSNEYTMENHDSMRIRDNKFYWNSQNTGGNALDFCMKYYNMDFREAVSSLLSFNGYNRDNYEPPISSNIQSQKQEPPQPEPIINPLPNELDIRTNRVYAYLTKTRMIDVDVAQKLINDGKIAQDIKGNAVFKIFDPTAPNELSGAEITGTLTEKRYKQVTERNGNGFTFNPSGSAPESAIFFEAAIDLLSYYSLHKDTKALLVSMAGLKDKVVLKTIADYKLNPEQCFISSDNDEAGLNFAAKMEEKHGVPVHRVLDDPLFNNYSNANIKDWNDLLKEVKSHQNIEHSQAKNVSEAKKEIEITKSVEEFDKNITLYKVGDFYEALNEDAAVISDVLNINITSKTVDNDRLPLAGFPKHILSDNVLKLAENNIGVNLGNYNEFVNSYIENKKKISETEQEALNVDEIYKAFQEHKTIKLTDISSNSNEINLIENARKNNFYNIRLEYNNATTDDLNAGFVMRADTDEEKDVVLRNYGEQSPEEMYSLIKDDYAVTGIEERTLSDKLARSELSFAEQVDNVLNGTANRYADLKVCDTPQILLDVGLEQLPILYTQRHLRDALMPRGTTGEAIHHHGLSINDIKKIPNAIENPIMIYDSLSRNDSVVVLTELVDANNNPIIAVIRPNGNGKYNLDVIPSNFMLSIHGRENIDRQIENALREDKILYYDKEKSQELFRVLGLQLSKGVNNLDYNIIIHQSRNIVNKNEEVSEKLSEINTENVLEVSEAKTTKNEDTQQNKIIGNEPYKYVYQKESIQVDNNIADNVISQLEAADFRFYGEINDDNSVTLFTLSRHHLFELDKIVKDVQQQQQQQKVDEPVSLMSDESEINISGPEITNIQNLEPLENDNVDNVDIALTTDETTENDIEQRFNDIYSDLYNNYDTDEKMSSISNEFKSAVNAFDEVIINNPQKYPEINNLYKDFVTSREDIITSDREAAAFMFALNDGIKYVDVNALEKKTVRNVVETDLTLPANLSESVNSHNYHINNYEIASTPKAKYRDNVAALKTLFTIEMENRQATAAEQEMLAKYVGWGGLADVFDNKKYNWKNENTELKNLLSEDEYRAASGSTLNAHYTSPDIIKGMYKALDNLGFEKGNILEPSMGIGNFFGMLPDKMRNSKLYGVELDNITGRIAKQLYPDAAIDIKGFEKTAYSDNTFDIVIGNVPFGNYQVNDRNYNKYSMQIHDYFIAKSIDKVRPGGIVAVITSQGTMDKKNSSVRRYFAERAELLGAIRLPNTAFKSNAGTEVTSDILFFQKRQEPIELTEANLPLWVDVDTNLNGMTLNKYFVENANMIIGEMREINGRYGLKTACILDNQNDFNKLFDNAINNIKGKITDAEVAIDEEAVGEYIEADPNVQNFNYAVVNNEIYYRNNSIMEKMKFNPTKSKRIIEMIKLRDCTRELINLQLYDYPDADIKAKQQQLNTLYDDFVSQYGYVNSKANSLAMDGDSSYCLLCSLENFDSENKYIGKADIFTKRTIRNKQEIEHVETVAEALSVSLAEKGKIDIEYMANLCGSTTDEIINNSNGVMFLNPVSKKFETNDEYLSGNVRKKLAIAEHYAAYNSKFEVNVEALKAVQPKYIEAADIDVRLGATWVDAKYINQFMKEVLNKSDYVEAIFVEKTSEWHIKNKNSCWSNVLVESKYGIPEANAYYILENALNLKDMKITYKNSDGKYVVDEKATILANQKQQELKEIFKDWIFKDIDRRDELAKAYNEKFNSTRLREYDGSFLNFVGMSPEITLLPHQTSAIARTLFGGNSLLAHCVGAGKTFEMAASAMESKRLGLCSKSMFVVPNHLTQQWGSEFLRLYPGANILVTSKKDFEPANRRKFCSKIATGNWDAVIIGHSQFEKIPLSRERQEKYLQNEIDDIVIAIETLKRQSGDRSSIKSLERTRKSLMQHLEKLMDSEKDDVITFEQLGVDKLYIDESHNYKNLFFYTKMRNVAGLSQTEAKKSTDMYNKCKYMDEVTDNRGIVFATGTPISNSMTELYTNMRYLASSRLNKLGISNFDAWASTFGETLTSVELKPEGTGYRAKTRFAKFFNLPELMNIFKEFADIQTADMLSLPVPEAEYHNEVLKPTDIQKNWIKSLADRAENVRSGNVDPTVDNMLKITNDGRKIALDQRLFNSAIGEATESKSDLCVNNAIKLYNKYNHMKAAQLIFCDLSTPKKDGTFNIYDDIKQKLISKGIPSSEIAFIHDANTDTRKKELFAKVRSGSVRFLLGSTSKMGAGTNVQDRLIALHHLDVPWRPSDLEQREGRILRQGNRNEKVHIFRYVTEGTFDSYSWQIIENKQKFIGQIMTSKSPVRAAEDIDETALSYAEVKALATGNPLIKEKMDLDIKVSKLTLAKSNYNREIYSLENAISKVIPSKISKTKEQLSNYINDVSMLQEKYSKDKFSMIIEKKTYTKAIDAMAAIKVITKNNFKETTKPLENIGSFCGFKLNIQLETSMRSDGKMNNNLYLVLQGNTQHKFELSDNSQGNVTKLNNLLEKMPERIEELKEKLSLLENNLSVAKKEVQQPFKYEDELKSAQERLLEVETAINNPSENKCLENSLDDLPVNYKEGQQVNGLKDIVAAAQKQLINQNKQQMQTKTKNSINLD